jgi:hypothetical protein
VRLGHLLAPAGVRYVAFLRRAAPDDAPAGEPRARLDAALARQLDLALSRVDEDGDVYLNEAWIARRAFAPPGAADTAIDDTDPLHASLRIDPADFTGIAGEDGSSEPIGPGTVVWSEAADGGWHGSAGGRALAHREAFGWTNAYAVDATTPVGVHYDGGWARALFGFVCIAAWLAALAAWVLTRPRRLGRRRSAGSSA